MNHTEHLSTAPAAFLVDNIHLLPKGRTLDVAMGYGRNAIYLAGIGFEVEGVDISVEAVSGALEAARKADVTITALVADLESGHEIEKNAYNLIICFNYLQRSLINRMKEGLKHGGMLVYETFLVDQARWGKPKNPDFLLKHNELLDMFRELRVLRYREGIFEEQGERRAIASVVAEKI
jgi:SAM-dependent methyltransferase